MRKKLKTHKTGQSYYTKCGLALCYVNANRNWYAVTCKNCLRTRKKKK